VWIIQIIIIITKRMYNKKNLSITSLILLSYMTTHIDKSPIMAQRIRAGPRKPFLSLFIFRDNVWFFTMAKILVTYRCRSPAPSQPQDVFGESGTRGSNEHARHGTYSLVQHSFHLQQENIHDARQRRN